MPEAFIDRIDTLHAVEENGALRRLTRKIRVKNIDRTAIGNDYTALNTAIDAAGVPQVPAKLAGAGNEMLRLASRSVSIVDEDPSTFDVTLDYVHVLDGAQEMQPDAVIYGRVKTAIIQVPTNFYIDWSDPDNPVPVQIVVQHRFPAQVEVLGIVVIQADPDFPGELITQSGTVQATLSQTTYSVDFFFNTAVPWSIKDDIHNCVNLDVFLGKPARTWFCSDVQYEVVSEGRYKFHVEWQHNPDTWDPGVVFEDKRTGEPPPFLVEGVGYKTVEVDNAVNFYDAFPPGVKFGDFPNP